MKLRNATWVCLADGKHGRLLECGLTPHGRCHVEQHDSIENTWTGRERNPSSSPLRRRTGTTYGIEDRHGDEEVRRFAQEVAGWLEHRMDDLDVQRLVVLASPDFLGTLRKVQPASLAGRIEERRGELTHFPLPALADHPTIRKLVGCYRPVP